MRPRSRPASGEPPQPTRREFLAGLGAAATLPLLEGLPFRARPVFDFRVRTITAGVAAASPGNLAPFEAALDLLARGKRRLEAAGYEVQTVRLATPALFAGSDPAERARRLPALQALDRLARERGAMLSLGPVLVHDRPDRELPAWAAELVGSTRVAQFSLAVASAGQGVHAKAVRTAAEVCLALSRVLPDGVANFRFAAAALVPAGTPFFPVAHHAGPDSIAVGLETPRLVRRALGSDGDTGAGERRLRAALDAALGPVERSMRGFAREERRHYLGIDPSPAPGMDSSIGEAIEGFTGVPFGGPATLAACAAVTAALKSLAVATCGYAGLMLPVLEDPVLAARAAEGRFGLQELLLFSSVCGTGLDVIPVPGDAAPEDLARVIGDMAALAVRLGKPLAARLFPMPGKRAGDAVAFADPLLARSVVLPLAGPAPR